jgi:cell shape-determining protein MreC
MKKTFLTRRNALLSSGSISWGGYALLLALALLLVRLIAPNFFLHITAPVFGVADALSTKTHIFFSRFGDAAALTIQNEKLQEENAALASENQALIQKEAELTRLIGSTALSKIVPFSVLAGVVARPPESPYDTLILDKGTHNGVVVGQGAFGPGGVPIGLITVALPDFSRVTLFSAAGMTVIGSAGDTAVPVTLVGSGAGTLSASLSRASGVVVGDTVSVPGPGTLPLGTVVRIDGDPSSPSMTLRIQPIVNLFSIAWVSLRDRGVALTRMPLSATSTPR